MYLNKTLSYLVIHTRTSWRHTWRLFVCPCFIKHRVFVCKTGGSDAMQTVKHFSTHNKDTEFSW